MTSTAPSTAGLGLALLSPRNLDAPFAWRHGVPVSARQFLADVQRFAQTMPAKGPVVNLCVDRYAFAVCLAGALVRGQASLLPPDARAETLERLHESGDTTYVATDDAAVSAPGLEKLNVRIAGDGAATDWQPEPLDPDMHAVSLLTSGSTGAPQPHAKKWRTLVGDVEAAVKRLASLLERPSLEGLTLVATVPVQHSYGLESSVLLAMLGGAAFEGGRPFFPADIAAALASVPRPRALVTTPFHLKTLLLSGIELPAADLILSATAPLSPQLAAQAEQALGGPLIEIYGSTESGQVATRRTTQSEVWQTFGDIRVDARADGDEPERFFFSGDFIPEPTPMADVLELIDPQQFRLLGRANDLIHVAGRRSSLGHLNYHLNSVAGVRDGAFWLPDEVTDGVVRPVAFVVAPEVSAASIIAALRQRVEAVFVPRRVVHVTALPREATGKLGVRALREFAMAQLAADGDVVRVTREVSASHPVFAGHFPGQPLLPGALILSEVLEAIGQAPALVARLGSSPTLGAVKFLAAIRPGSRMLIELVPEQGATSGVRFEVRVGDAVAATGRWVPSQEAA